MQDIKDVKTIQSRSIIAILIQIRLALRHKALLFDLKGNSW